MRDRVLSLPLSVSLSLSISLSLCVCVCVCVCLSVSLSTAFSSKAQSSSDPAVGAKEWLDGDVAPRELYNWCPMRRSGCGPLTRFIQLGRHILMSS